MPAQDTSPPKLSFIYTYSITCVSAAVAESVTFPLDITKTRLQIQGEQLRVVQPRRGMVGTAAGIFREEGVRGLWRGITPAVLRHVVYSGCRMNFYEIAREHVFKRNPDGSFPLYKGVLAGMSTGALAQLIASPTDLVKVQMQMEGRRVSEGLPRKYKGTFDAFRTILQTNGLKGLWKGCVPNMQRAALVNLGDLTTYDQAKQFLLKHTPLGDTTTTHAVSSLTAGLVGAAFGTPADVIKSRIMNTPDLYKSTLDCLAKTVKNEGVGALWTGFIPVWLRFAPWSLTFWIVNEKIRRYAGASSF